MTVKLKICRVDNSHRNTIVIQATGYWGDGDEQFVFNESYSATDWMLATDQMRVLQFIVDDNCYTYETAADLEEKWCHPRGIKTKESPYEDWRLTIPVDSMSYEMLPRIEKLECWYYDAVGARKSMELVGEDDVTD